MRRLGGKLTYANVMSTLCFFLLVTGGAAYAAAHLGKNSVGTKQLKASSVTTAKIRNGAVTGAKITASTLGTVPTAMNAQNLGGKSADQIEQSSKLRCPSGTEPAAGVCFETSDRPEATFQEALNVCGRADRSLPAVGDLATYLLTQPVETEGWAGSPFFYEGGFYAPWVSGDSSSVGAGVAGSATTKPYRCATQASN